MRFAKVTQHGASIVEVPDGGGVGREYHPWAPDDHWPAEFAWHSEHAAEITVGEYVLTVARVGSSLLRGVETGPYGEHIFDVVELADHWAPLTTFAGRSWVLFRPPPASSAWLDVPEDFVTDERDSVLQIEGMRNGWSATVRVSSAPSPHTPTVPLRYDTDSGERWDKYTWYGPSETLELDRHRACLRSESVTMYQVLHRSDRPEWVSGQDGFSNRADAGA